MPALILLSPILILLFFYLSKRFMPYLHSKNLFIPVYRHTLILYIFINIYNYLSDSVVLVTNMWYVHLITSNINWLITALSYLICSIYYLVLYIINWDPLELILVKVMILILLVIIHVVYILMSYHTD